MNQKASLIRNPVIVTLLTGAGLFVVWCVADYMYVERSSHYPSKGDGAWYLLVCGGVLGLHLHLLGGWVFLSILTTLFSCAIAAMLIVTVGIRFHIAIGGHL